MSALTKSTTVVLMLFAIIPMVHTSARAKLVTMETEIIAVSVILLFTVPIEWWLNSFILSMKQFEMKVIIIVF